MNDSEASHSAETGLSRYPASLQRALHVFGAVMIVVSAVTPAASVWVIAPVVMATQGSGAFLVFVAAAIIGVGMSFSWSELGAIYPIAGGDYSIIARIFGAAPGFLMFALYLTLAIFIPSAIGLGAGQYVQVVWPHVNANLVGALIIAGATLVAILHIRTNAVITGVFLFIELAAISTVIVLAIFFSKTGLHWGELIHPHVFTESGQRTAATFSLLASGIAVGLFSYNGYHWVLFLSEEVHLGGARRKLVTAIFISFVITIAAELLPITFAILGAPNLAAFQHAPSPMAYIVSNLGTPTLNKIVSLGIVLAVFNAVLACIISLSRILYSSGRDRGWPGPVSGWLSSTLPRVHTPWVAILVIGAIGTVLTATSKVAALVTFTGVLLALDYGAIAVAAIASRFIQKNVERPYKMPLWPLWPLIGIAGTAYTLTLQTAHDLIICGIIFGVALIYYYGYLRPHSATNWRMLTAVEEIPEEPPEAELSKEIV